MAATAPSASAPPHPSETRDRLLQAAIAVFERDGYDGARVADIARAAGLTTGAIYSQYRGKAALLFDAISTRTRQEVDELLEVASGEEARAVLAALGRRLATDADPRTPSLLVDAIGAARRDPDLAAHVLATLERREQTLIDLIERARAVGDVAPDLDAGAIARFCLAIAIGSLTIRTIGLVPIDPDHWTHLLTRLLHAVAPTPGDTAP